MLTKAFVLRLLGYGGLIGAATLVAFHQGLTVSAATASTMAFSTLTLARLFHGFNCRSDRSIFRVGFGSNKWSLAAFAAGVCLLALVLFVPQLHGLFLVSTLSADQLLWIGGLAFLPTVCIQAWRVLGDVKRSGR